MGKKGVWVGISFAIIFYLAIFVLRLGWFVVPIFAIGLGLSLLFSFRLYGKSSLLGTAVAYAVFTSLIWVIFVDQKHTHTFLMTWNSGKESNQFKEREVILEFADFPGYQDGHYSNELYDYLSSRSKDKIEVVFEITSDFGCMRGYHIKRVGDLETFKSAWGYSRVVGEGDPKHSPWPSRWWCP